MTYIPEEVEEALDWLAPVDYEAKVAELNYIRQLENEIRTEARRKAAHDTQLRSTNG